VWTGRHRYWIKLHLPENSFSIIFLAGDLRVSLDEITEHLRRSQRFTERTWYFKWTVAACGRAFRIKRSEEQRSTGEKDFNRVYQSRDKQYGAFERCTVRSIGSRLIRKNSCFREKKDHRSRRWLETRDSEISVWETLYVKCIILKKNICIKHNKNKYIKHNKKHVKSIIKINLFRYAKIIHPMIFIYSASYHVITI
jgi:hypothetical protein